MITISTGDYSTVELKVVLTGFFLCTVSIMSSRGLYRGKTL